MEDTAGSLTWYRGFIQGKTRVVMAWVFAALLIATARDYPHWFGVVVCFAGATLRFWASGYLRKDSRPAVGGPYAFVRNPLYLGTYVMALGTAAAIENWILLAALTVLFAATYHYIILDEETKLEKIFGNPYQLYKASVPRFFPRAWPPFFPARKTDLLKINPEKDHLRFSWSLAQKNKAYEAYASFAGLIGFVTLVAWVWKSWVS